MLTVGVDAHKRTNVAVALDATGREAGRWRGPHGVAGWHQLAAWAATLDRDARWGIARAWKYGRGLAQYLVATGATVYEVNARWTAAGRRRARTPGKSDRLDARAVALVVWREVGTLPAVTADETGVVDLLVSERAGIVAEATRLRNQLHLLLLQLAPDYRTHIPSLKSARGLRAMEGYATDDARTLPQQRVAALRRLAQRLQLLVAQARDHAAQIGELAATRFAPLTTICGVDLLTTGALAGFPGPGRRFASDAQLPAYAGVAPLEASSAERVRPHLNGGGNRQRNAILYRIAVTQTRCSPAAQAYLARRVSEGKTKREARRAPKRFIARNIWRQWQACLTSTPERLAAYSSISRPGRARFLFTLAWPAGPRPRRPRQEHPTSRSSDRRSGLWRPRPVRRRDAGPGMENALIVGPPEGGLDRGALAEKSVRRRYAARHYVWGRSPRIGRAACVLP